MASWKGHPIPGPRLVGAVEPRRFRARNTPLLLEEPPTRGGLGAEAKGEAWDKSDATQRNATPPFLARDTNLTGLRIGLLGGLHEPGLVSRLAAYLARA